MYDNPCNYCDNLENCMPRMNMPMANMPMDKPIEDMPMANMPMPNMPMHHMHMPNMPMMPMPMHMMNMPDYDEDDDDDDDDDLKKLYPKIYKRIYPIVKHHCDMIEARNGTMYCPSKDEMDRISMEIYDKCEDYYRDDYGTEDFNGVDFDVDEDMRQRRRRRRRIRRPAVGDLIRILFLRDLIGRRRRRRPHYGYY